MSRTIEERLEQAEAALRQGDADLGESLCLAILEEDASNASALFHLGTLNYQRQNFSLALQQLAKAAELEPEAVDIAVNLSGLLMQLGDRKQAIRVLYRATQYCQDDPVFCPRIADMLVTLGEPKAAVQLLSRLNVMPPQDQIILARAYGRMSHWREAVGILNRLHEATPDNVLVAEQLSNSAAQLRDFPLAIKSFERVLQLSTPTARDYLRFADLLLIAQEPKRCRQALALAAEKGESSAELHVLTARLERLAGDYPAAIKAAQKAVSLDSFNGQAWAVIAELEGDAELAEKSKELVSVLNSGDATNVTPFHQAQLHYALADMQHRLGRYSEAGKALTSANAVQTAQLDQQGAKYSAAYTEQMVEYIQTEFSHAVFEQANAQIMEQEPTIQPIFIVGMPRSGTTLVERILGQHKSVTTGGEQEALEYLATDFRQQVAGGKLPSPVDISTEQWTELRSGYLQRLPEISTAIFTDKMPHNFRHVGLILKMFPEARVIQMHRDLADVSLSIYSHSFPLGHNYATNLDNIAHFYQQAERLMQYWSEIETTRILNVRYEDLVTNPEESAKQLVAFCGFGWDDSFLEFHNSVASSFTFSELQVRQPIADNRIGRWRDYADVLPELKTMAGTD